MEIGDDPGPLRRTIDLPDSARVWNPRMNTPQDLLDRLDSRHDELIQKLDELNAQIEAALAQFAKARNEAAPATDVVEVAQSTERRLRRAA